MPQFSRQSLETFQTQLDEMDDDCSDSLNLRQFVGLSFESIQRARSRKASWEKITLILKEASGSTAAVSPQSIRQYYYEFLNHPERLGGKKKGKGKQSGALPRRRKARSPSPQPLQTASSSQQEALPTAEPLSSPTLVPSATKAVAAQPQTQESLQAQFNLSRRRL